MTRPVNGSRATRSPVPPAAASVRRSRDIREEIGAELVDIRYLGTLESIHQYLGRPRHEIVGIYEAGLSDASLSERDLIEGAEEDGEPLVCTWKPIADFERGDPLYPEGLLELLRSETAR